MKQKQIPWLNKVPGLRTACNLEDLCSPQRKEIKCCHNCRWFGTSPMASPGGWCAKYPSKQVNTDETSVCERFAWNVTVLPL